MGFPHTWLRPLKKFHKSPRVDPADRIPSGRRLSTVALVQEEADYKESMEPPHNIQSQPFGRGPSGHKNPGLFQGASCETGISSIEEPREASSIGPRHVCEETGEDSSAFRFGFVQGSYLGMCSDERLQNFP